MRVQPNSAALPGPQYLDGGNGSAVVPGLVADPQSQYTDGGIEQQLTDEGKAALAAALAKDGSSTVSLPEAKQMLAQLTHDRFDNNGAAEELRTFYDTHANQFSPQAQLYMERFFKLDANLDELEPIEGVVQTPNAGEPAFNEGMHELAPKAAWVNTKEPLFAPGEVHWNDVVQRHVGDCGLVASTIALARLKPSFIKKMMWQNPDGSISANLFVRAPGAKLPTRVTVTTDSLMPVDPADGPNGRIATATERTPRDLWPTALEKLMAQLKGGYSNVENDWAGSYLQALTGNPAETMNVFPDSNPDDVWKSLQDKLAKKEAVVACTYCADNDGNDDPVTGRPTVDLYFQNTKLVGSHQFAVLGTSEDKKGNRFVEIRNPWGFSDLENRTADDGIFKVSLADFIHFMMRVDSVRTDNL